MGRDRGARCTVGIKDRTPTETTTVFVNVYFVPQTFSVEDNIPSSPVVENLFQLKGIQIDILTQKLSSFVFRL